MSQFFLDCLFGASDFVANGFRPQSPELRMSNRVRTKMYACLAQVADLVPCQAIGALEASRGLANICGRQEYRGTETVPVESRKSVGVEILIAVVKGENCQLFALSPRGLDSIHCLLQTDCLVILLVKMAHVIRKNGWRRRRPVVRVSSLFSNFRNAVVHQDWNARLASEGIALQWARKI